MGKIGEYVSDAKAWWKSKTIIGTILMLLPTIIKLIAPSTEIDVAGTVDVVFEGAEGLAAYADSIWEMAIEIIGFVVAVYGRIKAKVGIKPVL